VSHFAVFVVTPEFPTEAVLTKTLAPWHEFECTGRDDEYIVDVDKTDEAKARFAEDTETRLRDADGNLHNRFDEQGDWKPEFLSLMTIACPVLAGRSSSLKGSRRSRCPQARS
jgi:hypothetical protein